MFKVKDRMEHSREIYPEVRVEEIFAEICRENSVWKIDEKKLGIETSRVFRAASIRKLHAFPQSIKLIEHCINVPKCIVSNGQRVFSELELRFLGLYDYFRFRDLLVGCRVQETRPQAFYDCTQKNGT